MVLAHLAAEEQLLYPPLKHDLPTLLARALGIHGNLRGRLERLAVGGDGWPASSDAFRQAMSGRS